MSSIRIRVVRLVAHIVMQVLWGDMSVWMSTIGGYYVFVKKNAVELLRHDLKALKNKGKDKTVFFSSVTDPYQGVEAKYKLTRSCLEVLVENQFAGEVSILTKSALVKRDIDVLKKLKNVEVGFTITSTDDAVSRYFEKFAPNVTDRLKAMK